MPHLALAPGKRPSTHTHTQSTSMVPITDIKCSGRAERLYVVVVGWHGEVSPPSHQIFSYPPKIFCLANNTIKIVVRLDNHKYLG